MQRVSVVCAQDELIEIEKTVAKTRGDNMTIVLTHYPSSIITTDHPRLRKILKYVSNIEQPIIQLPYLCNIQLSINIMPNVSAAIQLLIKAALYLYNYVWENLFFQKLTGDYCMK